MHTDSDPKNSARPACTADAPPPPASPKRSALRAIAITLARHEIRKLKRFYAEFDHDILLPLLLGEIALHNIGVLENAIGVRDDDNDGVGVLKPCNAYSIAAATGLPRETVRRKIARLVELGWISKRSNGHLYVTESALEHFGGLLRSHDLPDLLETADRVRKLLADVGPPPHGK
ncbi:MAG TPA: hypothetical protein PL143_11620 [Rhodocyclaceae bacterium]|nr:hypothetical protein [Rhodocyclaceae bacterium]